MSTKVVAACRVCQGPILQSKDLVMTDGRGLHTETTLYCGHCGIMYHHTPQRMTKQEVKVLTEYSKRLERKHGKIQQVHKKPPAGSAGTSGGLE